MTDGRFDAERLELGAALAERDQQRAKQGGDVQPGRNRHVDDHSARRRAQDEPAGEAEDVQQDDVLERRAVHGGQQRIRKGEHAEQQAEQKSSAKTNDDEGDTQP